MLERMTEKELATLASWIARVRNSRKQPGRRRSSKDSAAGRSRPGFPLARAIVFIDTLHPIHEGRVFPLGSSIKPAATVSEYGAEHWKARNRRALAQKSARYRLLENWRDLTDAPARHGRNRARVRALSRIVGGGGDHRVCGDR